MSPFALIRLARAALASLLLGVSTTVGAALIELDALEVGPAARPVADTRPPVERLREALGAAQAATSHAEREAAFDSVIDYAYIARWSAGRLHGSLGNEGRKAMLGTVRAHMLDGLMNYVGVVPLEGVPAKDVTLSVGSTRDAGSGAVVVPVTATHTTSGKVVNLDFRMHRGEYGFVVYDVVANGASATAFYREYFGDIIRRHGPEVFSANP